MLPEQAFQPRNGRMGMTLEGGGGGPSHTTSTVTQSSLPDWLRPQTEALLGAGTQEYFTTTRDPKTGQQTITGLKPYTPYSTDPRSYVAGFSPQQQEVMSEARYMQTPGQFGAGANMIQAAGMRSLGAEYQPGQFGVMGVQAPNLSQYQMGPAQQVGAERIGVPMMATAQTNFSPDLQQFQMGPAMGVSAQQVRAPMMQTAQTRFRPDLQAFQMGPVQDISNIPQVGLEGIQAAQTGFRPNLERFQMAAPERFGAEQAQMYADPYMQQVVDVQKRKAIEDAQRAQLGANLGAVRQGTYGGARQLLAQTEREKALGQQLGDIQATGSQAAFQQAQQQFERDRAAGMTAQQRNLEAALGVQQLGTQTGLQTALANLTNEQQARVQSEANRLQAQGMNQESALRSALANQQARLTTEQQNLAARLGVQELGTRTGLEAALANLSAAQQANVQNQSAQLQAMGMNQEQALRAALANQQAGLTVGQQNLAAQLQTQQLGTQTGLQTALANLSAAQQANVQNQATQLQAMGMNQEQALRAALANQQAGLTTGQQNLQALLGVQQLGAGQSMEAQRANQQAMLEAQRMAEQSRQFGGEFGLRGASQAIQAGQQLGQIGQTQQQADLARLQYQMQLGGEQRAREQAIIDQAVQNFALAQESPFQRLAGYSGLLRGYATPTMTTESYRAGPSPASQLAGLGALAYGAGMPGRKKGGMIKEGIDSLAITKAKRKKVEA